MTESVYEKHEIMQEIGRKCNEFGETIASKLVAVSILKSGHKNVFPHIEMIKRFYPVTNYEVFNTAFQEISGSLSICPTEGTGSTGSTEGTGIKSPDLSANS